MVGELNNWSLDHLVPGWVKVAGSLCIYLVLAQAALAGKSAPYGEYFVRVDERWPDAGGVRSEPEADAGSAAQDNASFQTQLSRLEAQGGPYADGLAEPLADLARLHRRSGDVAQALTRGAADGALAAVVEQHHGEGADDEGQEVEGAAHVE